MASTKVDSIEATYSTRTHGRKLVRIRHLGYIATLAALSLSTTWAAEKCRLLQLPSVPVIMMGLRPTIPAELDGNKTRLLVDTGAFFDTLSPAEATQFKLPLSDTPMGYYITGGLGNLHPQIATVKSLKLGSLSFPRGAVFLVGANDIGNGIAGSLGQNLYRVLDVEFDFANGVMRFFQSINCRGAFLAYWAASAPQSVSVLDLEERGEQDPHLLGPVLVNGHSLTALFDTGSATSILSLGAARRLGLSPGSAGVMNVGASDHVWSAPIDKMQIGDNETIEHTHILVEDHYPPGAAMVIGADFFLSHRVYLATSQSKLYFTYNGGPVFDLNPVPAAQARTGPVAAIGLPAHAASQALRPTTSVTSASGGGAPPDADGLMRRGLAYADRLQFQAALADLTQACQLAPHNADYRYQRGVVYWRAEQQNLALQDFDAAIKLDPDDFQARLWRAQARLFMQMRRKPDPKTGADPGLEADSVDGQALPGTNVHLPTRPDSKSDPRIEDDAKADLDAVDRSAPAEADLRLTLGRAYEDIGQYTEAVHEYDLWITNHPQDYRLAVALTWRCGSRARANVALDQALKDCNRAYDLMGVSWWSGHTRWPVSWIAPLLGTRSLISLRQGDFKRSIADDNAAINLLPTDAYALYARGLAEIRQGLKAQGQADLAPAGKLDAGVAKRFASMGLTP